MRALPCRPKHYACCAAFAGLWVQLGVLCSVGAAAAQGSSSADTGTVRLHPLQTASSLAARPSLCDSTHESTQTAAVGWAQLGRADVRQRCTKVAQGRTRVVTEPRVVLEWFRPSAKPDGKTSPRPGATPTAESELRFAERLLHARALLRTGLASTAYAEFSALRAEKSFVGWHAEAVHDFAVSAAHTGHHAVASEAYRRLASLASWMPHGMKVSVFVEAASAMLRVSPQRALEASNLLRELAAETLGSDVAWTISALRLVAEAQSNDARLPTMAPSPTLPWSAPSLRLAPEDKRFLAALAEYSHTNEWPTRLDDTEPRSVPDVTSPAYLTVMRRLGVRP